MSYVNPKIRHLSRFSETLRDTCVSKEYVCVTVELEGGVLPPNVRENKPLFKIILILVYSCLQGSVQMLFLNELSRLNLISRQIRED